MLFRSATVSWADVATLKASVRWDGRDDAVSGGRVDAGRVGSVVLRYRGAVNTTMRLVFDSRYLYIIRGPGQQESRQSGEQHVRVEERAT